MLDFEWLDMNYSHDNLEINEINSYETKQHQQCHTNQNGHQVCVWVEVQEGKTLKDDKITGGGIGGRIRF